MLRWLAPVVLIACSHADPATTTMPSKAAPSPAGACAALADKLQPLFEGATVPARSLRDVIAHRCEQDGWSEEARSCLSAIKTVADADTCNAKLTKPQRDALDKDGDDLIKKGDKSVAPAGVDAPQPVRDGGDPCEGGE